MRNWPGSSLASPVSGALFGAIRGSTRHPSRISLVRPCNYRRIGRASHTSSPATPCFGGLGPPEGPHGGGGGMGERIVQYGLPRKIVDMRPLRGLPDPILQIFNSRLVGLGKCRMNQVSSQSGRMYKASRCPTSFLARVVPEDLVRHRGLQLYVRLHQSDIGDKFSVGVVCISTISSHTIAFFYTLNIPQSLHSSSTWLVVVCPSPPARLLVAT